MTVTLRKAATILAAGATGLMALVATPGNPVAAQTAVTGPALPPAWHGRLGPPRSVNLRDVAKAAPVAGQHPALSHAVVTHRNSGSHTGAPLAPAAPRVFAPATAGGAASASAAAAPATPQLLTTFPGASLNGDVATYPTDQNVTPPDTQLAAGPSSLVEAVNSSLWVWSKAGAVLGSADLKVFFALPSGYGFTDPRVAYDTESSRWFVSGAAFNMANDSIVYIAASATSDPTGMYHVYTVSSRAAVIQDQPKFGYDSGVVVLSWSDGSGSPVMFSGEEIWVLQKSDLIAGIGPALVSYAPDPLRFDVVPVQSLAPATTEYLVYNNSCTSNSSSSCTTPSFSSLGLIAITGTPAGSNVSRAETDPAMSGTAIPPDADQPGVLASVATNDDRFLAATSDGTRLYVSASDACLPSGDTLMRPCARLVEVGLASGTVVVDGDFGYGGADVYDPAAMPDGNGNAFVATTYSSTARYPEAVGLVLAAGSSTFSGTDFQPGGGAYGYNTCGSGNGCRWGDYSGAAVDPSNPMDVWLAAEYAPSTSGNWGTAVGEMTALPAVTGVSPAKGATGGGAIVTITGTRFTGATSVQFGGHAAANVAVIDDSTIQATSPAGVAATVDVGVTTLFGSSPTSSADHFTYVTPAAGSYQPVQPTRICDTRPVQAGVASNQCNNGSIGSTGPLGPRGYKTIDVCSGAGAGCSLGAVAINVTVTGATGTSYLTVYPAGANPPNASNLNFVPGSAPGGTVANLVEVKVGTNGMVTLFNSTASVDVIVDLEGTIAGGVSSSGSPGLYTPVTPQRICDTRATQSGVTTNQCNNGGGGAALGSGSTLTVQITTQGGLPATGVAAVVINLTAVGFSTNGYLTAWPAANPRPTASNVNWTAFPGLPAVPNRVIVPVGHNGQISIYNFSGRADVIVDVNGWYGDGTEPSPPGTVFTGITPIRICDTRADSPGTVTNECNNNGSGSSMQSNQAMTVQVTSVGGAAPAGAKAVAINVTVTGTALSSYLSAWPSDAGQTTISDLNWQAGETVPNMLIVKLSAAGQINVFNLAGRTDVIIDVVGYYT